MYSAADADAVAAADAAAAGAVDAGAAVVAAYSYSSGSFVATTTEIVFVRLASNAWTIQRKLRPEAQPDLVRRSHRPDHGSSGIRLLLTVALFAPGTR